MMPFPVKLVSPSEEPTSVELSHRNRFGQTALKMSSAGGVMYPPQPAPIPMPKVPSPKEVGEWVEGVFGKLPGVKSGGPDPNDKE